MNWEVALHEDPKREKDYTVHHFVDNELDRHDYGILEIEQMHYEVRQAFIDRDESLADGGVPTSDPEAVAERWRDRVERGLILLDAMEEYLEHMPSSILCKTSPKKGMWTKIRAIVEEDDNEN